MLSADTDPDARRVHKGPSGDRNRQGGLSPDRNQFFPYGNLSDFSGVFSGGGGWPQKLRPDGDTDGGAFRATGIFILPAGA